MYVFMYIYREKKIERGEEKEKEREEVKEIGRERERNRDGEWGDKEREGGKMWLSGDGVGTRDPHHTF